MIVSIALNPSIDRLAVVESIAVGEIHRPLAVTAVAGGKGLNAARSARALGADVAVAGIFGGHAGRWIVEELAREGIEVVDTWCGGETRSSLSVYGRSDDSLTEFYEPGPSISTEEWGDFAETIAGAVEGRSWVTVSGSLPRGVPAEAIAEVVDTCRGADARVAVDLRAEALAAVLEVRPDLVKVNLAEASEARGAKNTDSPTWEEVGELAASLARKAGCHAAVVTCGSRGAVMCLEGDVWVGEQSTVGPYPVGSGDAFLGAMAFDMERAGDWVRAFRLGLGAGAANSTMPGAGRFDPDGARELARAVSVRRLRG